MQWCFGERIDRWTKGVVDPYSVDEAAEHHDKGKAYATLLFDTTNKVVVGLELVLGKPFARVHFYDSLGRAYLTYLLQASNERSELFLSQTRFGDYETDDVDAEPVRSEVRRVHEVGRKVCLQTTDKPLNLLERQGGRNGRVTPLDAL